MNIVHCIQGSPEWLAERCGKVTASRMNDVMAYLKRGGETAARMAYKVELVSEQLTGMAAQHYVSAEMLWGTENEPLARAAYEMRSGNDVDQVGLVLHPSIEQAAASPDGLVGLSGILECKCPTTKTHLGWILAGEVPEEHRDQMHWQMACTGAEWGDFVSFDPRLPSRYQLFIKRLPRDEGRIAELEDGVRLFLHEVDDLIEALNQKMPELPPPAPAEMDENGLTDDDIAAAYPAWKGNA